MPKTTLMPGLRTRKRSNDRIYYFFDAGFDADGKRKEIALGSDRFEAIRQWAELAGRRASIPVVEHPTFATAATRYAKEIIPTKAQRTQKDNMAELAMLMEFFGKPPAPLHKLKPLHVTQYMSWRTKKARDLEAQRNAKRIADGKPALPIRADIGAVRANREKALLSHILNAARGWGLMDIPNPCADLRGFKESGRNIFVDDDVYTAIRDAAEPHLQIAMDIAELTGQRPSDVYAMTWNSIRDSAEGPVIFVRQGKTAAPVRIRIDDELAKVLDAARALRVGNDDSAPLITTPNGVKFDKQNIAVHWRRAREEAAKATPRLASEIRAAQFRDLRARAGTNQDDLAGISAARDLLGHTTEAMTRHYVRHRRGKIVDPVSRTKKQGKQTAG